MPFLFTLIKSASLLIFLLFCISYTKQTNPVIKNGVLDLSSWKFESAGTVSCNGLWEYYGNQLLEPRDFTSDFPQNKNNSYGDPGVWNDLKPDSSSINAGGFATYRLIITGIDTVRSKAIRLADQSAAYRLWIDGVEYSRQGIIGNTRAQSRPFSGIDIVSFHPHQKRLEIVMQVCSFWYSFSNGGSIGPIFVGDETQIRMGQDKRWVFQLFIISTLFIMGLYNIVIYLMRRKDRCPLYFGIFCLLISTNILVSASGDWLLQELSHMLPGLHLYKIDIITIMISIPCFIMFIHSYFPLESKKYVIRITQIITVFFLPIVVFLSGRPLAIAFELFYLVIIAMIVYSVIIAIDAVKKERTDAIWVLAGIIIMSIAGINDVLWGMGVLHTPILVPSATFLFILIYSILISRRFSLAFAGAEQLSVELLENQRLRDEMQIRIKQEQDLRQVQRQLTELLHVVDDALCTVYDTGEIAFCNRAFEELAGFSLAQLAGKKLEQILCIKYEKNTDSTPPIADREKKSPNRMTMIDSRGNSIIRDIIKIPLELEEEELSVLVFRIPGLDNAKSISAIAIIEALNRNRNRIQSLEELMTRVTPDVVQANPKLSQELKIIDMNLEKMQRLLTNDEVLEKKKLLGAEIICLTIQYWIESTGKTKTDLARESNLWKVQTNQDGWERTQTLDRYMDIKTFPKIPRWNQITKTTDFVLIRCTDPSPLRAQLQTALQQLHILS